MKQPNAVRARIPEPFARRVKDLQNKTGWSEQKTVGTLIHAGILATCYPTENPSRVVGMEAITASIAAAIDLQYAIRRAGGSK